MTVHLDEADNTKNSTEPKQQLRVLGEESKWFRHEEFVSFLLWESHASAAWSFGGLAGIVNRVEDLVRSLKTFQDAGSALRVVNSDGADRRTNGCANSSAVPSLPRVSDLGLLGELRGTRSTYWNLVEGIRSRPRTISSRVPSIAQTPLGSQRLAGRLRTENSSGESRP